MSDLVQLRPGSWCWLHLPLHVSSYAFLESWFNNQFKRGRSNFTCKRGIIFAAHHVKLCHLKIIQKVHFGKFWCVIHWIFTFHWKDSDGLGSSENDYSTLSSWISHSDLMISSSAGLWTLLSLRFNVNAKKSVWSLMSFHFVDFST